MAPIGRTPEAADDLESIAELIARSSPQYAQVFNRDSLG